MKNLTVPVRGTNKSVFRCGWGASSHQLKKGGLKENKNKYLGFVPSQPNFLIRPRVGKLPCPLSWCGGLPGHQVENGNAGGLGHRDPAPAPPQYQG